MRWEYRLLDDPREDIFLGYHRRALRVAQPPFGRKSIVRSINSSGKTHDWQYVELKVDAADLEAAPWFATVTLTSAGKGKVWFDDLSCVETPASGLANHSPEIGAAANDPA